MHCQSYGNEKAERDSELRKDLWFGRYCCLSVQLLIPLLLKWKASGFPIWKTNAFGWT